MLLTMIFCWIFFKAWDDIAQLCDFFSHKNGMILTRYVIGKWDLESGVEYGWLTSLGSHLIILI